MRPILSPRLVNRTLVRTLRKRTTRPADFIEDATTFADKHTVLSDPFTPLPYPPDQLLGHLNEVRKQELTVRAPHLKTEKLRSALTFDHIPIERQIVAMFPGHDEQHLGMGSRLEDHRPSMQVFEQASELLGYNIFDLCRNGPKNKLDQTIYRQPALFVSSMAALEKLRSQVPDFEERITDAAGFGVGEFCALVLGGILKFEEALKIVAEQAKIIHECNQVTSANWLTVHVKASSELGKAIKEAREVAIETGEAPLCEIAAYLYCGVKVVGASKSCARYLYENSERFNFKIVSQSKIPGAPYTGLMRPGEPELVNFVRYMDFGNSPINVYSNYTGTVYPRKKGEIRRCIIKQFSNPIKWEQIIQLLYRKNQKHKFPTFCEVGPGKQLGNILWNVSKKAHAHYSHVPC